jgi:hypothetical protein
MFIMDYTCVAVRGSGLRVGYCQEMAQKWKQKTALSAIDALGASEVSTSPEIITDCIFIF